MPLVRGIKGFGVVVNSSLPFFLHPSNSIAMFDVIFKAFKEAVSCHVENFCWVLY